MLKHILVRLFIAAALLSAAVYCKKTITHLLYSAQNALAP